MCQFAGKTDDRRRRSRAEVFDVFAFLARLLFEVCARVDPLAQLARLDGRVAAAGGLDPVLGRPQQRLSHQAQLEGGRVDHAATLLALRGSSTRGGGGRA